jgi:fumarate hydratase class I
MNLKQGIVALYKKVSTSLPPDVEKAVKHATESDGDEENRNLLGQILKTTSRSRSEKRPLCVDTGVPVFFVSIPDGINRGEVRNTIIESTREATQKVPLAPSAVDAVTGTNTGDNTGDGFPVIYFEETDGTKLSVELMLLGAGTEGLGRTYSLPEESIGAGRDLEGVRSVVLDAVNHAQGKACPPYLIGVGIAATRDRAALLSKQQFRRKLEDVNPNEALAGLESALVDEINKQAGKSLVLGVKVGAHHRHPESYFVDVSFLCWNTRRGKLIW